jgi:hypothetical protein
MATDTVLGPDAFIQLALRELEHIIGANASHGTATAAGRAIGALEKARSLLTYDEAKAVASIERYHRIAGILRKFYTSPISASTLQPILDLATEFNPELRPRTTP